MAETSEINRSLGELEDELKKIKSAAELITEARVVAEKTIEETKQLSTTSEKLVKGVNTLVSKIDKIDFPSRLDKVDATVSGINSGMQNILSRLETVERHFDDSYRKMKEDSENQYKNIRSHLDELSTSFRSSQKSNKILLIIIMILMIISLSMPFITR